MAMDVQKVAIEMIQGIKPLIDQISKYDRSLAKQLKESASSVALNIAEGAQSRAGHQIERFFTAAGSNSETRVALEVAAAWGYIRNRDRKKVDAILDRIAAMLWRLTHHK